MSGQLYKRTIVEIRAVDGVERESGVRLYCQQADLSWALQLRSPLTLRNGREGKDFLIATASLQREQMVALRDAINHFLSEDYTQDLPDEFDDAKAKVSP